MGSNTANVASRLEIARLHHQHGRLQQAGEAYEEILAQHPRHSEALMLRGVLAAQSGDPGAALASLEAAIEADPRNAIAFNYRGMALIELQKWDAALASFDRAIAVDAACFQAHHYRAYLLERLGRPQEALAGYDRAIAIAPRFADAHYNRGVVLQKAGRLEDALAAYERALAIRSNHAETHFNIGILHKEFARWSEAAADFDRALTIRPDFAEAHSNLCLVQRALKQPELALASAARAVELRPNWAEAHANRGNALRDLHRLDAALASYERALALDPRNVLAHVNRGIIRRELQQFEAACASFKLAIELDPGNVEAHTELAFVLLLRGDFENGWLEYEWRERRRLGQPLWLGVESVAGKTILLHGEQGFGDMIQFCRFTAAIADRGARVVLEVPRPLARLFATVRGLSELVIAGEPLPPFDFHCPLMSLPLALKLSLGEIPHETPYLCCDADTLARWRDRLGTPARPRIGLAWSGNPDNGNESRRSIPFAILRRHLPPEFDYVALQLGMSDADRQITGEPRVADYSAQRRDFSDTAALCECMDLVITVDTSIAHLSGALGKTTWTLLARDADWRWLTERNDTPWYPRMRLFRQATPGDWSSVLDRVTAEIRSALGRA